MIQAVERAAAILGALGSGTPRLGVTEIAERVGLAKPTAYGLLRTLVAQELVTQDAATGKYSLGPGVLQLSNAYLDGSELRARSLTWAESLARRANEAVWVATLSGTRVIVLHHVFRPDNTVQVLEVGAAIPWHACAPGHAIAAYLGPAETARLMAAERVRLTGRTITDRDALARALADVRGRGFALEDQEATVGDAGIAAPVVDRTGAVAGAIGVVGPTERLLADGARGELTRAVTDAARSLSRDMGAGRGRAALSALIERDSHAGLRRRRRPGHHQHPVHDLRPCRQRGRQAPVRARAGPAAGGVGGAQPD